MLFLSDMCSWPSTRWDMLRVVLDHQQLLLFWSMSLLDVVINLDNTKNRNYEQFRYFVRITYIQSC